MSAFMSLLKSASARFVGVFPAEKLVDEAKDGMAQAAPVGGTTGVVVMSRNQPPEIDPEFDGKSSRTKRRHSPLGL
jgi:hypothetical protein